MEYKFDGIDAVVDENLDIAFDNLDEDAGLIIADLLNGYDVMKGEIAALNERNKKLNKKIAELSDNNWGIQG